MRGPRLRARWMVGLPATLAVLVAVALGWSATAGAEPAQGSGECMEVGRSRYGMPDTITPPEDPSNYGTPDLPPGTANGIPSDDPDQPAVDVVYVVQYCRQDDGLWHKTQDAFSDLGDSELCVHVTYEQEEHGDRPPPDAVTPLEEIDQLGRLHPWEDTESAQDLVQYCRQGDTWALNGRSVQPQGSYTEWSEECVTILPVGQEPPRTIEGHPEAHGTTEFRVEYVDVRQLRTYCRTADAAPETGPWYLVEDYPLSEIVDYEYQDDLPEQGTCFVIVTPIFEGHPPEDILPPGHPSDYGTIIPKQDYESMDGVPPLDEKYLFCFVNGAWRRGDKVGEGCANENPGILVDESLLPDECWGAFPTANYDIGYNGGSWDNFSAKLYGWWTDFFFSLGKGATSVALRSIGWAYQFDMGDYEDFALTIGDRYRVNLTENASFRLEYVAFMVLFGWAGFTALRGRVSQAGGEIVMSIVLMSLAAVLLAHRGDYMRSVEEVMDKTSVDLLVAGQGEDPSKGDGDEATVVRQTQGQIHEAFVEQPYDYLNWGHLVSGRCAEVRNEVLGLGPHGTRAWPREQMDAAGCDNEVEFNAEPNGTRLLASLLSMSAVAVVMGMLVAIALTVVVGKFAALLLFAVTPFVALVAILPAGGRRLAWLWLTTLVQVFVAVVGMAFVLSLLLLSVEALMETTADLGLIERFLVVLLAVLVLSMVRRRLLASGQSSAGRLVDNLTNFRLGGGGTPWVGPSGSQGANLLAVDRGLRHVAVKGAWATGTGAALAGRLAGRGVALGGRVVAQRLRERRAWHNIVKARLTGDAVQAGELQISYGPRPKLGGKQAGRNGEDGGPGPAPPTGPKPGPVPHGPGPAGGVAAAAPRSGPVPQGSGPPGGGAAAGSKPGPVPHGPGPSGAAGPAAGHTPPPMAPPTRVVPTTYERKAKAAAAQGDDHAHRFWQGVDIAAGRYELVTSSSRDVGAIGRAEREFTTHVGDLRSRYEKATGKEAPMVHEPWQRPSKGSAGSTRSPDMRPSPPSPSPTVEVRPIESYGDRRWSKQAIVDHFANRRARRRVDG